MKRTSPPVPVTARPVETPGIAVRSTDSWKKRWRPRASCTASASMTIGASASPEAIRVAARAQQLAELALELAHAGLAGVLGDHAAQDRVGDLDLVRRAGRCASAGAAAGSRGRSPASPRSCSRRRRSPPCGPAAAPGSCRAGSRWRGRRPRRGRPRRRGSGRGRSGSGPGRAPPAGPPRGRRASRRRPCRPRRAGSPGSSSRRRAGRGRSGPAGRRCRCGGGRGSRPRRGCRRGRCGRTRARGRGRSDSPIEVLPVPGGPTRVRIAPLARLSSSISRSSRSLRTAMNSVIRRFTSSRPAWSASSTSRVCSGSSRSSERFDHGTAISQSR